jgi:excisionase family DNA binding protein
MKNTGVTPRLLLTAQEAAKALSICERTLWTLTNTGSLKSVRIGRSVRYAIDDLQTYIQENRTAGIGAPESGS